MLDSRTVEYRLHFTTPLTFFGMYPAMGVALYRRGKSPCVRVDELAGDMSQLTLVQLALDPPWLD